MRKSILAAIVAACTLAGCSAITGYPTDKAESYAKAIEVVRKNVDG